MKLIWIWKLRPSWIASTILEGAMQASGEEKVSTFLVAMNAASYVTASLAGFAFGTTLGVGL